MKQKYKKNKNIIARVTPAAVIHCHKVAFAFVGIGHLVVKETQVDLSIVRKGDSDQMKSRDTTKVKGE